MIGNFGNLIEGLQTTVIGMGIVFFVLYILSVIVGLFKYLNKNSSMQDNTDKHLEEDDVPFDIDVSMQDDIELVAVITAAIASLQNTDVSNINIKSIRKHSAKWKMQTLVDSQNSL